MPNSDDPPTALTDEGFEGTGTLVHSSNQVPIGATGMRITNNGFVLALTYDSPWMYYTFDDKLCFSTKLAKHGKTRTFFVQRDGEPRVQVDEAEWTRQFNEAQTKPR